MRSIINENMGLRLSAAVLSALLLSAGALFAVEGYVDVTGQAIRGETNSSKFTEYRTVPEGVYVKGLGLAADYGDSGYYLQLSARKPGLDDQGFLLKGGKWGLLKWGLGYSQLPHNYSETARSFYVHDGNGNLRISDRLQGSDALAGGATYFADVPSVALKIRRDTLSTFVALQPLGGLDVKLGFSQEDQNGTKVRGIYSPLHEVAEPIRYQTRSVSANIGFARNDFALALDYTGSLFANEIDRLVVDNISSLSDTAASNGRSTPSRFGIALPPDNQAHNVTLGGGANLPFWDSPQNASLSYGRMLQNDSFLPVTVNNTLQAHANALGVSLLPTQSSLNGKINTLAANTALTLRPLKPLAVKVKARYYKLDNQTPQLLFNTITRLDTLFSTSTPKTGFNDIYMRRTMPTGYSKFSAGSDVSYQILPTLGAAIGYEWERMDRVRRETQRSNEHTLKLSVDYLPQRWIAFRPSFLRANRYHERYETEDVAHEIFPVGEGINVIGDSPLLRKYEQANRLRDVAALKTSIYPTDEVTLDAEYSYRQDDYAGTGIGVQKEINHFYGVDLTYEPLEILTLYGNYSRERNAMDMRSRYRESGSRTRLPFDLPSNDWVAKFDDVTDSFGLGANSVLVEKKLDMDLSYYFSRSRGQMLAYNPSLLLTDGRLGQGNSASTQISNATAINFPETKAEQHRVATALRWYVLENLTARLSYEYERYEVEDFAFEFINVWQKAWPTSIFLGSRQDSYYAHIVALSLIYKF